jgi:hypothetical protein
MNLARFHEIEAIDRYNHSKENVVINIDLIASFEFSEDGTVYIFMSGMHSEIGLYYWVTKSEYDAIAEKFVINTSTK